MGRPRRPVALVPWVRSTEAALPDAYRHNFVIRDPELIAFLVRGVPHGHITGAMERLMREGYDRMVATNQIDPANHLTAAELAAIRSGHRKAAKAARAEAAPRDTHDEPSFRVAPVNPIAPPARGPGSVVPPAPPPSPTPLDVADEATAINDDDASVLLGAGG